jgi:hypothetical protein
MPVALEVPQEGFADVAAGHKVAILPVPAARYALPGSVERDSDGLADDLGHDAARKAAPQQVISQSGRGLEGGRPLQRRHPAAGQPARFLELVATF